MRLCFSSGEDMSLDLQLMNTVSLRQFSLPVYFTNHINPEYNIKSYFIMKGFAVNGPSLQASTVNLVEDS